MFGCMFVIGVARAFQQPAKSSFLPQLVPRDDFFQRRHLEPGRISIGLGGRAGAGRLGAGAVRLRLCRLPAASRWPRRLFIGLLFRVRHVP